MTTRRQVRGKRSERGEGNAKLIVYLLVLGIVGYLGIMNVPKYLYMHNLKTDLEDLGRTSGARGLTVDRVRPRADELARKYEIPVQDIKVEQEGRGLSVSLHTVQKIDLIVTEYDWVVEQTTKQQPF
ncbi:MAG: hypothetical protein IPF53_10220 [Blastocatellia bacterium]|nr:hypothetical protein [Blastocatellia bacterium]MBK6424992.1 hypothetical protein [Blastocatellia bacterium]